ncbi:CxC2 domain-containing protein [Mycena kentingensis (nom. inval.)]|nr:CxC2 domain-containing protein [Mycena kentingensis (nom. inval.)]
MWRPWAAQPPGSVGDTRIQLSKDRQRVTTHLNVGSSKRLRTVSPEVEASNVEGIDFPPFDEPYGAQDLREDFNNPDDALFHQIAAEPKTRRKTYLAARQSYARVAPARTGLLGRDAAHGGIWPGVLASEMHAMSGHRRGVLSLPSMRTKWTGTFWTSFAAFAPDSPLAMVYQIGHAGGACNTPSPPLQEKPRQLVVLHVNGVFKISVRCGITGARYDQPSDLTAGFVGVQTPCVFDTTTSRNSWAKPGFCVFKGTYRYTTLSGLWERLTDATFINKVPDRYKAFSRMSRQYDYLTRAKRAGRGHAGPQGLKETEAGGLAVRCLACPDPGRNMPEGWKDAPPARGIQARANALALDANFRLKNRIRANELDDPSLGPGLGYFVFSDAYKEHLRKYVGDADASTCIAFQALLQQETKLTAGFASIGRWGLCDLQKGERYANMDFIFMCAVDGSEVQRIVISYDIACQWQQRLRTRVAQLADSPHIKTALEQYEIRFGLPVWHAKVHEEKCRSALSLTFVVGVGRTDGEGIERTWAIMNPMSYATKEMGEGNRLDTLEGKVDQINAEKNANLGDSLQRKELLAVVERDKAVAEFAELDAGVQPEDRAAWTAQIDAWNLDKTKPNPFILDDKQAGPSEAQVLADLKNAELEDLRAGRGLVWDGKVTAAAFIKAGMQLEEQQRRIKADATPAISAEKASQLDELRVDLVKKIRGFERQQSLFMPGVDELRAAEAEARVDGAEDAGPEDTKLWLPSDLTEEEREWACGEGLVEAEARLRAAQVEGTLVSIRGQVFARAHVVAERNANAVGQRAGTRSGTLLGRMGTRLARDAARYRQSWKAARSLKGEGFIPQFKELRDEDLRVVGEDEPDAAARAALGCIGAPHRVRQEPSATLSNRTVSWIWALRTEEENDRAMHDSVRLEWSKSRARRDRWIEEVELIREEKKRVLLGLATLEREWMERAGRTHERDAELDAALAAYALRQANLAARRASHFETLWGMDVHRAVQKAAGNAPEDVADDEEIEAAEEAMAAISLMDTDL